MKKKKKVLKWYLRRERRRFSALIMRSVEVGIQRRIEGQKRPVSEEVVVVDLPNSSAIFLDNQRDRIVFINL